MHSSFTEQSQQTRFNILASHVFLVNKDPPNSENKICKGTGAKKYQYGDRDCQATEDLSLHSWFWKFTNVLTRRWEAARPHGEESGLSGSRFESPGFPLQTGLLPQDSDLRPGSLSLSGFLPEAGLPPCPGFPLQAGLPPRIPSSDSVPSIPGFPLQAGLPPRIPSSDRVPSSGFPLQTGLT